MKIDKNIRPDIPMRLFKNQKEWNKWLDKNHADSPGIWLRISKKGSNVKSVTYNEALETALCYGWIDGQKNKYDDQTWLQKFTRRGTKSIWSKINRKKAEELIKNDMMKPAGLTAVEAAKKNGRWKAAYDSHSTAKIPKDFQIELNKNSKAKEFFTTLNSTNRYAILFRIQTAKRSETREKRIRQFITMLENHEKIHP